MNITLIEEHSENSYKDFWNAINIFIFKQHVINRRLSGIQNLSFFKFSDTNEDFKFNSLNFEQNCEDIITELKSGNHGAHQIQMEDVIEIMKTESTNQNKIIIFQKLMPRNMEKFQIQNILCYLDFTETQITFKSIGIDLPGNLFPNFDFAIQFKSSNLLINVNSAEHVNSKSGQWLKTSLFDKLKKWICNNYDRKNEVDTIKSLSQISEEKYSKLYNKLKEKYGEEMVKIWPENTDPLKFVYEDIGIATYLILLWEAENESFHLDKKQSFVDLGCGNGLLVYLLIKEGYSGFGIDLRKRTIWDLFSDDVRLREETINPSEDFIFPTTDWIIGNHSDELSPWIPVIAAKSSYHCRYFLLPCCAYEFDGTKYQRRHINSSQYNDFLDYAKEISTVCGFNTKTDRLKIPSTKRICLIGSDRYYQDVEFNNFKDKINEFIKKRSKHEFRARETVEKVKNCTQISKTIISEIVEIVFNKLIAKKNFSETFPNWNLGGTFMLSEIIKDIPIEKLKELKSECGGIQTLLKNHNQIFHVYEGKVKIRYPENLSQKLQHRNKKNKKDFVFKQKPCWFYVNHPDGCPFDDEECSYKH